MKRPFILVSFLLLFLGLHPHLAFAESVDWICDTLKDQSAYDTHPDLKDFKYLVAGRGDWIFETSNDLKPDYSIPPDSMKYIEKITAAFRRNGIELILVQMPGRGIVHGDQLPENINDYSTRGPFVPEEALKSYLNVSAYNKQHNTHLVNIPDLKIGEPFYYTTDLHWNAQGARRMAKAVADYINRKGLDRKLPKSQYESRLANTIPYKKAYPQLIEKICGTIVPEEKAEIWETAKLSSDIDNEALFADLYPQIVLIGTSFSLQQNAAANFQGFLEEYIRTDILNMSIAGGGEETAMIDYIRAGEHKQGKTRIAIWEIPGHYKLSLTAFITSFEQIYANLDADCETPLANGTIDLTKRSQVLLDVAKSNLGYGIDLAAQFEFSEAISPNFTYIYRTQTRKGETKRYKRQIKWPPVAGRHTRFLTTVDVSNDERLMAITVRGDLSLEDVRLKGSLCRLGPTGS